MKGVKELAILYIRDENGNRIPIPAIKGENGHQTFVRFSEYADGTDMSETWDDSRDYMGIAFAPVAPTNKSAYQWVRVSHFPNGMTLDADNNLHVKGEVTFGSDRFAPRAEIAKKVGVETGSYVGTGHSNGGSLWQYGEETVSLTFPFAVKRVDIFSNGHGSNSGYVIATALVVGTRVLFYSIRENETDDIEFNSISSPTVSADGKTFSWKLPASSSDQSARYLNFSGQTYYYTGIG